MVFTPTYKPPPKIVELVRKKDLDVNSRVYCNVELNGANLEAVGFDMDFTLAQYNEEFDKLAFEGAKAKLVQILKYPESVINFEYSKDRFIRGLVIDKKEGNILKLDRHKYPRKVYHGLNDELTKDKKKNIYTRRVYTFTEGSFVNIDTIFLLVDAVLFTCLVDLRDSIPDEKLSKTEGEIFLKGKTYEQLYNDVRESVNLCHIDGVIKDTVKKNPEKYITYDPNTVPMLQQLRDAGKKVFLLTNSLWDYTTVVMDYLVHGGSANHYPHLAWEDIFDVIVVGGDKPAFIQKDRLPMYKVDTRTGHLLNIEDKEVINPTTIQEHKVFQSGCWSDLHRMLNISYGDRLLYVGDHIFADILRSKRSLGWRTCLIVPELEDDMATAKRESKFHAELMEIRRIQSDLDAFIDSLRAKLSEAILEKKNIETIEAQLLVEEAKSKQNKINLRKLEEKYNRCFNKYWGPVFKAGQQDSRFAKQVMDYACLYTSRASNLVHVSPNRAFRPVQDFADDTLFDIEPQRPSSLQGLNQQ